MKLPLIISLACVGGLFFLQCAYCGEVPTEVSDSLVWWCTCTAAPTGVSHYTPVSNCSSSCNCIPDGGVWNCSCTSVQAMGTIHDASCFTSCNCTSDTPGKPPNGRDISSKGVAVILVLSVLLTSMSTVACIACYFHRKDKFSVKQHSMSSDRDTSWNSGKDSISQRSASLPEFQVKITSPVNPIAAFFRKISLVFGSQKRHFPGMIVQFSYFELEQATYKFSDDNLIGLGGSSSVYRGQLQDGRVAAIKKLKLFGATEGDDDFLTEIELISRLNHCHVVPLLGYCCESRGKNFERLLVFEYMSNGNLRDCLDASQGKEPMDWSIRVKIALGAAKGLEYLHEAAAPRILHRDIKSTNILLDDKYRAKITDLGMAKRLLNDDLTSCPSSPARMLGTFGYFAPEYAIVGKASLKSDVFSFGVVVLELITGRRPIHRLPNKSEESLVIWATGRLQNSKLVITELPDPALKGNFPKEEMQIMAHLARECLQWDPESRPSMSEVVRILCTIDPDKPRRKNFPSGLLSNPSTRSTKSAPEAESCASYVEKPQMDRASSERTQARCSLPLAVDHNLCEDEKNIQTVISAEFMDKLILLTSSSHARQPSDEVAVDLTEPRFESFVQPNCRSL